MKWTTTNVTLLVTILVTLTNGFNWLLHQNDRYNEILRIQEENQQTQVLQSKEYMSRIDILTNQHDRELRNIYIQLEDIHLEIERLNTKSALKTIETK